MVQIFLNLRADWDAKSLFQRDTTKSFYDIEARLGIDWGEGNRMQCLCSVQTLLDVCVTEKVLIRLSKHCLYDPRVAEGVLSLSKLATRYRILAADTTQNPDRYLQARQTFEIFEDQIDKLLMNKLWKPFSTRFCLRLLSTPHLFLGRIWRLSGDVLPPGAAAIPTNGLVVECCPVIRDGGLLRALELLNSNA